MPYTQGFDPGRDREHYDKHVVQQGEFGGITLQQYCDMADRFLGCPLDSTTTYECTTWDGAVIRYNDVTREFGILALGGAIRTYFKATPRRHGFPTNLEYFLWRCQQ